MDRPASGGSKAIIGLVMAVQVLPVLAVVLNSVGAAFFVQR